MCAAVQDDSSISLSMRKANLEFSSNKQGGKRRETVVRGCCNTKERVNSECNAKGAIFKANIQGPRAS
jgi:hypothetical protein